MRAQGRRDTQPELAVRRILFSRGHRYRVNYPVPGMARRTIDVAFPKAMVAVFLDGCFWHRCPEHGTSPKSNADWWRQKIDKNVERDQQTTHHLEDRGWTVIRCWEHQPPSAVADTIESLLQRSRRRP